MKLKNIFVVSAFLSSMLFAGGDIAPVEPMVEKVPVSVNAWNASASLNMWGAGISGETASYNEIDVPFSDILDSLDMTFMSTLRVEKGKWGIESDFVYLKIGDEIDDNLLIDRFSYKTWIVTPIMTYQVVDSGSLNLYILAGARYLYMKPSITTSKGTDRTTSGNLWDGIVGVKGMYDLDEKWFMPFHFDVGTGDTDMTWQAFAGVGYKYESFDLIAGYRYLDWNFEDSSPGGQVFNDLTIDGPIVGVKFRF